MQMRILLSFFWYLWVTFHTIRWDFGTRHLFNPVHRRKDVGTLLKSSANGVSFSEWVAQAFANAAGAGGLGRVCELLVICYFLALDLLRNHFYMSYCLFSLGFLKANPSGRPNNPKAVLRLPSGHPTFMKSNPKTDIFCTKLRISIDKYTIMTWMVNPGL